jgi:hypothetical protein
MSTDKISANFFERLRRTGCRGATVRDWEVALLKEQFIAVAPLLFEFEECACIFPDAALAGDYDFIERCVARFREQEPLKDQDACTIGLFWDSFGVLRAADVIPGLKHWSDRGAWELYRFISDAEKVSLEAYKQRKSRSRLHSERLKLVDWARLTRQDSTLRLRGTIG